MNDAAIDQVRHLQPAHGSTPLPDERGFGGTRRPRASGAGMALQAERIDLVERVLSFTTLSCSGDAWRNGSMVDIGSQYCCGLQQH